MRKLLTILAAAALLAGILVLAVGPVRTPVEINAILPARDGVPAESRSAYGNPDEAFARWDGLVYMLEYRNGYFGNSMNSPVIKAYRGDYCVDSCVIQGVCNTIQAEDGVCMITTGIDTLRFNLTYMPNTLDLRFYSALPEADTLSCRQRFHPSDKPWAGTFSAETALLPETHPGILQYIDSLLSEHTGTPSPEGTCGGKNGIKAMIDHYCARFRERCEASCKDLADSLSAARGPEYRCFFSAKPVWQSRDKRLVTYQFYGFSYVVGSAHGGMEEYFATFDAETGRRLHIRDIISPKGFRECIGLLESRLTGYKKSRMDYEGICLACVDGTGHEIPDGVDYTLREIFEHHLYPIPALTRHGIVFSYQPYEKGSFAEGILHFTIPYARIGGYLRPGILAEQMPGKMP